MRSFILGLVILTACTKHNPDSCCTTAEQCAAFGITDGITPCQAGKTCDATGSCVMAQCSSSSDCSADTPICENQLCVAKCTTNDECTAPGRPLCASDGVCVGCNMDSDCGADAPVCDQTTRSCRGCVADAECTGGICLESEGTCKADADVFFVTTGGTDAGSCSRNSPCATIPFVLAKAQPQYKYIHILGGSYDVATTLQINAACYLDGAGTMMKGPGGQPVLHIAYALGGGVVSGITVLGSTNPSTTVAVTVDVSATLEFFGSSIQNGLTIANGKVTLRQSKLSSASVLVAGAACSSGSVILEDDQIQGTFVSSDGCTFQMRRSRTDLVDGDCFRVSHGVATIENNLFVGTSQLQDCGSITSVSSGSTVRFNTFVNTSDLIADGAPLHCDGTSVVTSNIFAWGSTAPNAGGCTPTYSLFDNATTEPLGTGSLKGDISTFFANRATKDFHLAATSPALGKAESNTGVNSDFDGVARPASGPDIGAFEHR